MKVTTNQVTEMIMKSVNKKHTDSNFPLYNNSLPFMKIRSIPYLLKTETGKLKAGGKEGLLEGSRDL